MSYTIAAQGVPPSENISHLSHGGTNARKVRFLSNLILAFECDGTAQNLDPKRKGETVCHFLKQGTNGLIAGFL